MGDFLGVAAAVLSSALGGTSVGATRYLVGTLDPLAIGSFRFGIGFVQLLPVALLRGGDWPAQRDWPGVAALGLLFFALFPILFNASLIFTTAARVKERWSATATNAFRRSGSSTGRVMADRYDSS